MFCVLNGVDVVAGLWWGYNIGLAVQCVCLLIFVALLDWQNEAHKVSTVLSCV